MTTTHRSSDRELAIGILGTGNVARALARPWSAHGHRITVAGRSPRKAEAMASALGPNTVAGSLAETVRGSDVVLLAIPWDGVNDALECADIASGGLAGVTIIDPVNPVAHGVGTHLLEGGSAAEHISSRAPGARVVKAFNVYPAAHWAAPHPDDVVMLAGDDAIALEQVGLLVRHAGATPHVLGPMIRARQLEEVAGTVIGMAFAGANPRAAVPGIQ